MKANLRTWVKARRVLVEMWSGSRGTAVRHEQDEWYTTPNRLATRAVMALRDAGFILVDPPKIRRGSKLVLVEERPCDQNGRDGGVWCEHPFANCVGCTGNGTRLVKVTDL